MSDELTRLELEALKNALQTAARQAPPNDVPIPFTEKGCRRVGQIISQTAIAAGGKVREPKPKRKCD